MRKGFVDGLPEYVLLNRRCLRPCSPYSDSSQEWIAFGLLTAAFCHLIEWDLLYVSSVAKKKQPADLVLHR